MLSPRDALTCGLVFLTTATVWAAAPARPEKTTASLAAARATLVLDIDQAQSPDFLRTVRAAAPSFQTITVGTKVGAGIVQTVELNLDGSRLDGVRFVTPDSGRAPAFYWASTAPATGMSWSVVPLDGPLPALMKIHPIAGDYVGLRNDEGSVVLMEGTLTPKTEYILWFAFGDPGPVKLSMVLSVLNAPVAGKALDDILIEKALGLTPGPYLQGFREAQTSAQWAKLVQAFPERDDQLVPLLEKALMREVRTAGPGQRFRLPQVPACAKWGKVTYVHPALSLSPLPVAPLEQTPPASLILVSVEVVQQDILPRVKAAGVEPQEFHPEQYRGMPLCFTEYAATDGIPVQRDAARAVAPLAPGSVHRFKGTVKLGDTTFVGEGLRNSRLTFGLVPNHGYVYLRGKGKVIQPDSKEVVFAGE